MTEAKSGASELVGHARISFFIESAAVAFRWTPQGESVHRLLADHKRKPFVVRDVLKLGDNNSSRLFEDDVIRPAGIDLVQRFSNAIVLACEQQVKRDQGYVLVDSNIAGQEASGSMHQTIFRLWVQWKQLTVKVDEHLQLTMFEASQLLHRFHIRAVNRRSIDVVCHLRQRFRIAQLTIVIGRYRKSNEVHATLMKCSVELIVLVDEDRHASKVRFLRWQHR